LNIKSNREYRVQGLSQKEGDRPVAQFRRPFWFPASSYYILAAAAAIAFFFLIWAILHEDNEEAPWAAAGIGATFVLGGALIAREIFLKKARNRFLLAERKLEYNLKNFPAPTKTDSEAIKLTLEDNAAIIRQIQKKSEAARVLGKISSGHLEVFEVCGEYLAINEKQLGKVGVGSPRLPGLLRGRDVVGALHRYHLLSWAEIESRALTQKARNYATISEKLNTAQEALDVLNSALNVYPNEGRLRESEALLREFIASIKVSHWIEQAERAAFKGNYKRSISLYRDALFFLAREAVKTEERDAIAEKINAEIEILRGLSAEKEVNKRLNKS
jgi:tetratricopeptide (TPR) repeat protein